MNLQVVLGHGEPEMAPQPELRHSGDFSSLDTNHLSEPVAFYEPVSDFFIFLFFEVTLIIIFFNTHIKYQQFHCKV